MTLKAGLTILAKRMSRRQRGELLLVAVLSPLSALAEFASLTALVPLLASFSTGRSAAGPHLALFAMLILSATLFRLWLTWSTQRFAQHLGHSLNVEVQRRVLDQPYGFHLARHSSDLLASLDRVETLVEVIVVRGIQAISAIIAGGAIFLALLLINPRAAFAGAAFMAAVYGLSAIVVRRRLLTDGRIASDGYNERIRAVQDSLGGIRDVILDRSQGWHVERFRAIDRSLADVRIRGQTLAIIPRYVVEVVGVIGVAALAMWLSRTSGGLTAALPILGALALGAQRLLPLAQQLFHGWSGFATGRAALDDVAGLLALELKSDTSLPSALPFHHSVALENVSFSYHGRLPALEAVDLTIKRGERIVLVGASGSGKSTLADLVMGLIAPTRGRILVDGVELTRDNVASWQRNIAHVPQHLFLADASIADNVMLGGGEHDEEKLADALEAAHLAAFIASLPNGAGTLIGERGGRLSGGQRQRIGLARAVYRGAPFLILDEPFSALDEATERAIISTLDALQAAGSTILIISHGSRTVAERGRLVRLDRGKLAS